MHDQSALRLAAIALAGVLAFAARADEPCSGECPARALTEEPRWPLASLASAVAVAAQPADLILRDGRIITSWWVAARMDRWSRSIPSSPCGG
jgi:hypothetical protein